VEEARHVAPRRHDGPGCYAYYLRIFKAMDADKDGTRGLPHPKFTLCEIVGMY